MTVTIKKVGNWRRVRRRLLMTRDKGPDEFRKHSDKFAAMIRDKVREIIRKGVPPGNAKRTIGRKGHNLPLVWTMQYYKAINVRAEKIRRRSVYGKGTRAGVFEWDISPKAVNHIHPTTGKTINMISLGEILEYGATGNKNKIPPRPHFAPAAVWAQQNAHRYIESKYTKSRWLKVIWRR